MVPIKEKMRKHRLRWFEHVQRGPSGAIVKRYTMTFCHYIKRGCGRTKRTWTETIKKGIKQLELSIDMAYDKMKWKERICIHDLNSLGSGG